MLKPRRIIYMNFQQVAALRNKFNIKASPCEAVVALAGNPNTGKSSIFNALTGMRQHTGNWPGKTVMQTQGRFHFDNRDYILVDLPGTYSLFANSLDEKIARDFIFFACPDVTVVVTDATCLERNLNLVLQVIELTSRVIVCVNLIDEASKKAIFVDTKALSRELGVPVVATAARSGRGIKELKKMVRDVAVGKINSCPKTIKYDSEIEEAVKEVEKRIKKIVPEDVINPRGLALWLIGGNKSILEGIQTYFNIEGEVLA